MGYGNEKRKIIGFTLNHSVATTLNVKIIHDDIFTKTSNLQR